MNLKNKKITVAGLGKSGLAAAKFLLEKGAEVSVTEALSGKGVLENAKALKVLGARVETGGHTEGFVRSADLVVTSPGIPKTSLPLRSAKALKIPVISEIELAFAFCRGTVVGVTGSNGKTTTCHLIHHMVSQRGPAVLCGNVGFSFLDALPAVRPETTVVLELSSFQLEDCHRFRPKIAVLLNLGRNHLDRHGTLSAYRAAKARIFKNQGPGDILIANYDDPVTRRMAKDARSRVVFFSKKPLREGVFLTKGSLAVVLGRKERMRLDTRCFKLQGGHNLENILAAAAAAFFLKIPAVAIQKVLSGFQTLEHRLEPVGKARGVFFVNDSKSTTVESTKAAILASRPPLVLIAGGRDKGARFEELEGLLGKRVKFAVLYGESRKTIAGRWKSFRKFCLVKNFKAAFDAACRSASHGDTVLLSPMCTSFDQFSCFEERGEAFKRLVREMGRT
ncbi:MAG: UDP-N-acetylmuramoyl-L-alanine--D-glutamate ligase [Candidatus Omnitrophica bacterium]|nr:UDP-N-acetylmuramoyl-L-alanine--D-glutamate ligase [Candidatus Omnitrophota bacterium]